MNEKWYIFWSYYTYYGSQPRLVVNCRRKIVNQTKFDRESLNIMFSFIFYIQLVPESAAGLVPLNTSALFSGTTFSICQYLSSISKMHSVNMNVRLNRSH